MIWKIRLLKFITIISLDKILAKSKRKIEISSEKIPKNQVNRAHPNIRPKT